MRRRQLLGYTGAGLLAAQAAKAQSNEKITVRLDWSSWGGHSPFYLANQKGWYRNAGLDVEIEEGNGSVTTVQLVGNNQFDIGHASLGVMMLARGKGMKVRAIAGFVRKNDVGVIVPVDSPIRTVKDLAGKKVLYTAGSFETPFIDKFLAAGNLTRDQLELVSVEAASKIPVYVRGDAAAAFTSIPYSLPYVDARPSRGILFADYGLQFPGFGLLTTDDKIATRGPALAKFATIVSAAWEYTINGHEDEAVQAQIAALPGEKLNPKILRAHIETYRPYLYSAASKDLPIGVTAPKDWELAVTALQDAGVLPSGHNPTEFYTNEFVDPARIRSLSST